MNAAALFAGGLAAGLAAGTASCAAVQGGLLIGLVRPPPQVTAGTGECCGTPTAARAGGVARTKSPAKDTSSANVESPANTGGSAKTGGLAAVAAFLSGRLLSHVCAGALLGLAGSAVQIGPRTRAVMLVVAGVAVLALAFRLLRKRSTCSSPMPSKDPPSLAAVPAASGVGAPGFAARGFAARGFVLGAATILVPCGVTISLEIVAVSTGSGLGGAAVLAGLALGTTPALAALGLLMRGIASTRLSALAGVAALAAGLFTVASGLRLGGWLPDFGPPAATAGPARPYGGGTQRVVIWATGEGFRPGLASVAAGRPVELVFRTRDNGGCTRTVAIAGQDVALPVTGERAVRLPPQPPGRMRYACGMGMYIGFIEFEQVIPAPSAAKGLRNNAP
ncbi:sulfite exporter TauE/SafE family protein [Microbispora sp. NPDC049125]|uniref:urease accessory protein UreH domain-containing protein n=1 Tax=Microbispora sp. NPDC049125 TaxID=3154929 RepID=UPI0034662AB7